VARIFIAYRRDDAKPRALLLRDRLAEAFGATNVFLDKDALAAGDSRIRLHAALSDCRVMLVLIGPRWLADDVSRGLRLDDPDDVHREEIARALAAPQATVTPLLVDGAALPPADALPAELRRLLVQQAMALADASVHREIDTRAPVRRPARAARPSSVAAARAAARLRIGRRARTRRPGRRADRATRSGWRGPCRRAAHCAMRNAQLAQMRRPGRSDPFFWAAFVSIGDTAPMPRR